MKTILLRNESTTVITIRDMGITVPMGGNIDISEYPVEDLRESDRLRSAVASGNVIVNYEGDDLSVYEAIKIVDPANMLDIQKTHDINISFGGSNDALDYFECDTGSWQVIRAFFFRGEDRIGVPTTAQIVADVTNPSFPGEYRLINANTSEVISGWTVDSENPKIYTDTTIYNVPMGQTVLELIGKSYDAKVNRETKVYTLLIKF